MPFLFFDHRPLLQRLWINLRSQLVRLIGRLKYISLNKYYILLRFLLICGDGQMLSKSYKIVSDSQSALLVEGLKV